MKWYFALNEGAHASYFEVAKVAVVSCARNTSLEMNCVWDGAECEFLDWLRARDVVVHHSTVPFIDDLYKWSGRRGLNPDAARGAYLRTQIPVLEQTDPFVLYTDCDVVFQQDPVEYLSGVRPRYIAATLETNEVRTQFFNSGVMILNIPELQRVHDSFVDFISREVGQWVGFSANDQGAYNYFFRGNWDFMSSNVNWKPYWGINPEASIIHYHGMRPQEVTSYVAGGGARENKATFLNGKDLQSLVAYTRNYYQYIPEIYSSVSHIVSAAAVDGKLTVEIQPGEDVGAQPLLALECEVVGTDQRLVGSIKTAGFHKRVRFDVDMDSRRAKGGFHSVRTRLVHLPGEWFVTNAGLDASAEGYSVVENSNLPIGRLSACVERVWHAPVDAFRPFYLGLSSSGRLSALGENYDLEPLLESDYPAAVLPPRSIDRSRNALVHMPESLVLHSDGFVGRGAIKDIFSCEIRRAWARQVSSFDGRTFKLLVQPDPTQAILEPLNLLPNNPVGDTDAWLLDLVAAVSTFANCEITTSNRFLASELSEAQRGALEALGVSGDRLVLCDRDWVTVETLFVTTQAGRSGGFRASHDRWPEAALRRSLGPGASGGLVAMCPASTSRVPAWRDVVEAITAAGGQVLNQRQACFHEAIRVVRSANIILVFDDEGSELLAMSSSSASVLEIQVGESFRASRAFDVAMARSLAYNVVLISEFCALSGEILIKYIRDCTAKIRMGHVAHVDRERKRAVDVPNIREVAE